ISFGTVLHPADISLKAPRPENYLTEVSRYFNFYTLPITWKLSEPKQRGAFDFAFGDQVVEFAIAHNTKVKGHVLVLGGASLPEWLLKDDYSPEELKDILKNHIQTIINHFKDKYPNTVTAWHVVNEPLCEGGMVLDSKKCLDHGIEKNIWTNIHKPGSTDPTDYIQLAFQWAHEADPNAKLYINENNVETLYHPKTKRFYELVKYLKQTGTPIHGIGLQAHIRLYDKERYSSKDLTSIMDRFADMGLETQITEFDVVLASGNQRINSFTPTKQIPLIAPKNSDFLVQAELYSMFMDACLKAKNCTGFTTWGPWDPSSWTNNHWKGSFYPHLLDDNLNPKLAFKYLVNCVKKYDEENSY
ncbi:MAG: endo-1,4-beta-xylanase, partial [Ginsengibacter sp.]